MQPARGQPPGSVPPPGARQPAYAHAPPAAQPHAAPPAGAHPHAAGAHPRGPQPPQAVAAPRPAPAPAPAPAPLAAPSAGARPAPAVHARELSESQRELLAAETAVDSPHSQGGVPFSRHGSTFQSFLGRTLAGYKIQDLLGEGAMGAVFRARQLKLKRTVAVKVLPPALSNDRELIERFEREAQSLAKLDHPAIVPVYDMFEAEGLYFIAMGYCGGGSVKELMAAEGRLEEQTAAEIVFQTALGLWAAAEKGIVHRDIKPDNLLLTVEGRVKIADFGLVKAANEGDGEFTVPGTVMGTPATMSPEQWRDSRKTDHRSDLYSLGCTLYMMLTGAQVFPGPSSANLMEQHLMHPAPNISVSRPGLSSAMGQIVTRLLQKDPIHRFQTGKELAEAIAPLTGSTFDQGGTGLRPRRTVGSGEVPAPAPPELPRPGPPFAAPAAEGSPFLSPPLIVAYALIAVALIGFVINGLRDPEPTPDPSGGNRGNGGVELFGDGTLDLPEISQQALHAAPPDLRSLRNDVGYAAGRWNTFLAQWGGPVPAAAEKARKSLLDGDSFLIRKEYGQAKEAYKTSIRFYNKAITRPDADGDGG